MNDHDELPPCVGEKMRDVPTGWGFAPRRRTPQVQRRTAARNARDAAASPDKKPDFSPKRIVDHFRFALWAQQQPAPPTIAQIQAFTGLSYNAACIWHTAWLDARRPSLG